ncbi:MAG: tetratricopeptide (TPR) repeat protein [Rhodothermales bacterium]|jgi:tetratricopeptide (TPR) repeat protein
MRQTLVTLLLLLVLTIPAAAQSHRALITELAGAVTIQRANGTNTAASWGVQLFDGDVLTTGANSKAALLYSNGSLLSVAANSETRVEGNDASPAVDPTLLADVSDLTLQRTGFGELAALGGLRAGPRESVIDLQFPRQTRLMDANPTFDWATETAFEIYTVTVLSDDGQVWSGTTEESQLSYPTTAPALQSGMTYYWRVEGEEMLDMTRSELVQFEVMAPEEIDGITQAEAGIRAAFSDDSAAASRDFLLGSFYAKQGMNAEALATFRGIAKTQGDSAMLHEILGRLYYETGRKDLAVQSLKKALELSKL